MTVISNTKILPFNQFKRRCNNFCLFFVNNLIGSLYRESSVYQKCLSENKEKMEDISKRLQGHTNLHSLEYKTILYEAYIIMRPYVHSDYDLFK